MHLETWPQIDPEWLDTTLAQRWAAARTVRAEVFARLEQLRRDKVIGSSLEARVTMLLDGNSFVQTQGLDWAEILIVGQAEAKEATPEPAVPTGLPHAVSVLVDVERTTDRKCGRCWRHLPDVKEEGGLCTRCEEVVHG